VQDLGEFISAARRAVDADRLLSGGAAWSTCSRTRSWRPPWRCAAIASSGSAIGRAREVIDLDGRYVCPGLIDADAQTQALASVRSIAKPAHARAQHDHYKPVPTLA
jgi:hypothetical protein